MDSLQSFRYPEPRRTLQWLCSQHRSEGGNVWCSWFLCLRFLKRPGKPWGKEHFSSNIRKNLLRLIAIPLMTWELTSLPYSNCDFFFHSGTAAKQKTPSAEQTQVTLLGCLSCFCTLRHLFCKYSRPATWLAFSPLCVSPRLHWNKEMDPFLTLQMVPEQIPQCSHEPRDSVSGVEISGGCNYWMACAIAKIQENHCRFPLSSRRKENPSPQSTSSGLRIQVFLPGNRGWLSEMPPELCFLLPRCLLLASFGKRGCWRERVWCPSEWHKIFII